MPTVFDVLYREYCRARLAEMRKQLLLVSAESNEVAEACDVGESAGAFNLARGSASERINAYHERKSVIIPG